ncbi:MAG TPA: glycerophosphodiester phosphodiesterase [Chitinophagaceae bacterium]|nr:glycerophosphodiester phosphodiesterase [Chitinophagaceae bacterium]
MTFDKQGHRGCRGLMPENTIPAMLRAIDLGVTTLEMDISVSRDKKAVVSHDPWFNSMISTTPEGKYINASEEKKYALYQMDYAEIRKWDVGLKPHPLYAKQQKMAAYKPLLDELIDSAELYAHRKGIKPLYYNIETKCSPAGDGIYHPGPEEFTDLVMEVIIRKKIVKRTIIQSFDERTLQVLHRKYPTVKTAYLIEGTEKNTVAQNIDKLGFRPDIYSPEYRLVTPELISYCHANGMKVIPWTVNDAGQIRKLQEMGVDGIISDYPDLFNR